jgi:hypothetical protein
MTAIDSALPSPAKLPVWRTAVASYRDTFDNFGAFLAAAALPCLLTFALGILLPEDSGVPGAGFLRFLLENLFVAVFELAWFRLLLLRTPQTRPRLLPRLHRRLLPYLGYTLLMLLLHLPYVVFIYQPENLVDAPILTYVLIGVLYLAAVYFNLRFVFVYLWIAVDAEGRLGASWRATRKNGLRLMIVVLAVGIPLLLVLIAGGTLLVLLSPEYAVEAEAGTADGWFSWIDMVLTQILLFAYYGVSGAALTRAFCILTGWMSNRGELLERFE